MTMRACACKLEHIVVKVTKFINIAVVVVVVVLLSICRPTFKCTGEQRKSGNVVAFH